MIGQRCRMRETGWEVPLELEDYEPPQPRAGEILVKVEACGVCHRDLIDREGRFPFLQLPVTPGHEACGRVISAGEGAGFEVGARVALMHRESCGDCPACEAEQPSLCTFAAFVPGLLADGGYATHVCGPWRAFFAVPDDWDAALAATLHCTYGSAWRGLQAAGVESGKKVVITGANGGVGAAGVELARRLGCRVTGVIRDAAHADFVEAQGAHRVIVDTDGKFHKQVGGADLALECVGSPTFNGSLRSLKIGGKMAVIGNVSRERASVNLGLMVVMGLSVVGPGGGTPKDMEALIALHEQAPLKACFEDRVSLAEADAAQRRVRAGGLRGRIVLEMA